MGYRKKRFKKKWEEKITMIEQQNYIETVLPMYLKCLISLGFSQLIRSASFIYKQK